MISFVLDNSPNRLKPHIISHYLINKRSQFINTHTNINLDLLSLNCHHPKFLYSSI
jgi:hypothetical protein